MTPTEVEALVLEQARAYQSATVTYGRGKEERLLISSLSPGQEDTVAKWGKGGYGTKSVMSHYVVLMQFAGGRGERKSRAAG